MYLEWIMRISKLLALPILLCPSYTTSRSQNGHEKRTKRKITLIVGPLLPLEGTVNSTFKALLVFSNTASRILAVDVSGDAS